MKRAFAGWALAMAMLLAACATEDVSMNASLRSSLGQIDGTMLIAQSGLDVTVVPLHGFAQPPGRPV